MPQINGSDETLRRVAEFRQVIEEVIEQKLELDNCLDVIVHRGIDLMVAELLGPVEPETLLMSIQKLGARHPEQVYGFVAEVLKIGTDAEKRAAAERFGFHKLSRED